MSRGLAKTGRNRPKSAQIGKRFVAHLRNRAAEAINRNKFQKIFPQCFHWDSCDFDVFDPDFVVIGVYKRRNTSHIGLRCWLIDG
jgi:hypothetical protein